jgi:hypothetical protein
MAAACWLTPQSCSALIRRRLQRSCGSQTKQQRPWCGHTAAERLHAPAALSARGRDAATSICQRIHARPPVGFRHDRQWASVARFHLARLWHAARHAFACVRSALHLRQARELDLKARLKDAEDALKRREREQMEQAPAGFVLFPHYFRCTLSHSGADVTGACSSQCVLPVQVAALQQQLERQQVPVRPSRLHPSRSHWDRMRLAAAGMDLRCRRSKRSSTVSKSGAVCPTPLAYRDV